MARALHKGDRKGTEPRRTAAAAPAELTTRFRYDPVGNLIRVTNPRGVTSELEVNALNEVVVSTRGAEVAEAAAAGQLLTGEQPFRYRTRFTRDLNGRVTLVEVEDRDSTSQGLGGYVERSTGYDILGYPLEVTAEVDATTRLTTRLRYDPNQNLVEATAPEGNRVVTVYDERDLPLTITRGAGSLEASTVQVDYDRNGNRVQVTDAEDTDGDGARETTRWVLDGFDRPVEAIDALGNRALTSFDVVSNVVRSHPAGAPAGAPVVLADTRFAHDELGRVFRSDAELFLAGALAPVRPVSLLDQDGDGKVTTRLEYDALSRPTFVVEDDLETTRSSYDGASRLLESIDALGNRSQRVYDRNGNVVLATAVEVQPDGLVATETFTTRYVYDQLDRLVRATDNVGQTSRFGYDSRDNLVLRSDPEGPLTADPLGLFPGQINGPGNTCRYEHDGLSRMIRQVCDLRVGGTGAGALDTTNPRNPDGQVSLGYVFDKNSRLVGIVDDNGNRTSFGYDALDRRVSQQNADGEVFLSTYDRDGNVRSVTDPNGSVMTKTYDALNRLIQCDVLRAPGIGGTTRQTFAYDGLSRLVRATDDNGSLAATETCEWVYDSLGRALEERQSGRVVSSVYTGDGKRAQVTYPGGRVISRTFDAIDRIKTLSDPLGQLAQSDWIGPGLRELQRVNGNGTRLTFLNDAGNQDIGFDPVQRLVRLRVLGVGGGALVDREYAYNRASQRTLERRHDELGLTDTYSYDSVYRVVASTYDQGGLPGSVARDLSQISYRYDGVGNRRDVTKVSASAGSVSDSYAVNVMNEYASIGPLGAPVARTHDDNGNLTDDGSRVLVWDAFNRLVGVARKSDGAPVAQYFYLPDGRRSRKVVYSQSNPGVVASEVRSAWDGAQEVEEQSAAGVSLATFVWSPVYVDELVEFRREAAHPLGAGSFYAHQDARCDVVAVTDQSGQVVEKRRYDDFGREEIRDAGGAVVAASPSGLDYGFQGRRLDRETGWVYFRARFYEPESGRFLSRDPVWDAGNMGGWYSFAGNDPTNGCDPDGLQPRARRGGRTVMEEAEHFRRVGREADVRLRGLRPRGQRNSPDLDQWYSATRRPPTLEEIRRQRDFEFIERMREIYRERGRLPTYEEMNRIAESVHGSVPCPPRASGQGSGGSSTGTAPPWGPQPPGSTPRSPGPGEPGGPSGPLPPYGGSPSGRHIDIGGEGRYPGAININPGTTTTTTGTPGQPIPNLLRGRGEKIPVPDQFATFVTLENAPIRPAGFGGTPGTAAEIARVLEPGGQVRLFHPMTPENVFAHGTVSQAIGGRSTARVVTIEGVPFIETTIQQGPSVAPPP